MSLKDSTVYCTMEPCPNCAMSLIAIGVYRIVAANTYHAAQRSRDMFRRARIELVTMSRDTLYDS